MNKLDYYEIGKRIRKCREELGLTQEAAAEQCGISPSFYSDRKKPLKSRTFSSPNIDSFKTEHCHIGQFLSSSHVAAFHGLHRPQGSYPDFINSALAPL